MDEWCCTCRFALLRSSPWADAAPESCDFLCRRFPPGTSVHDVNYKSPHNGYVRVTGSMWCGEWQPDSAGTDNG